MEWVLGSGSERERKVGNCTREKVCPGSEWAGRGHGEVWEGRCGNSREGGSDGSRRNEGKGW